MNLPPLRDETSGGNLSSSSKTEFRTPSGPAGWTSGPRTPSGPAGFQKDIHSYFHSTFKEKTKNNFTLFPYQTLFASLFQVYPRLLLISEPGTGKSITFIEACEVALQTSVASHAYIFETSKILINGMLSQIYKSVIEPFELGKTDKSERTATTKYIKNLIRNKYTVTSYTKFYNKYNTLTDKELRKTFSNSIFVFDEVHKFIGSLDEKTTESKQLEFFYRMFSDKVISLPNQKIILVSATPLTTDVSQLEPYVKLLGLDVIRGFQPRKTYTSQYIKNLFLGYTSFVGMKNDSSVIKKFISRRPTTSDYNFITANKTKDFIDTDLYYSRLHSTQLETYKYYDAADKRGSYKSNIIQSAAFVFPDGTIGGMIESSFIGAQNAQQQFLFNENQDDDELFIYSQSLSDDRTKGLKKYAEDVSKDYKIPGIYQLKNTFRKSEHEDLSELSCKMDAIIKIEKENEKTPGTVFIYTGNMKNGGGAIMMSLMLEKYAGFTNFLKTGIFSRKSYVLLNTEMTENEKKRIVDIFNSRENRTGEKIRIIIGTSQLKEGISFFNCVRVHLLNRAWTTAEDYQSISRAIRTGGHSFLKEYYKEITGKEKSIDVNIYKHAVYYVDKKENKFFSVDLEIEKLNLDRQPPLDEIFEGFKEAAIDKLFFMDERSEKGERRVIKERIEPRKKELYKESEYFIKKDSFFVTLSSLDYKYSKNILSQNSYIEKNYSDKNDLTRDFIIFQKKNVVNTFLFKNSIKIFGNFQQNFNNRNRLYRFLEDPNRKSGSNKFNYLFFDFVYNNAMYRKNIFKITNSFLTADTKQSSFASDSLGLSFNENLKEINSNKLIESFYNKIKKSIFGMFDTSTKELKIIDKTYKENNKGKNIFSYSKDELDQLYRKLTKSSRKQEKFSKEFYYEEFYNFFKKNGLLLVV